MNFTRSLVPSKAIPAVDPGWIRSLANSPLAVPAMVLLSFLDACISPILPEVLLVPLCLAHPERRWIYATWCSMASVLGAIGGYYIGYGLWEAGMNHFAYEYIPGFTPAVFEATSLRFGSHGFVWIVLAAFTPLPFKVFTVAAGVCHDQISIQTLVLASVAGRYPRFLLEVWLIHRFGPGFLVAMRRPVWRMAVLIATGVALILMLL